MGLALDNSGTDCIHRQLYTTGWIYRGNGWSHGRMALGVVAGWSTFLWWSNLCYRLWGYVFIIRMAIIQKESVTCHSNKQAAFAALIITDRRGGSQQNGRHSVSHQLQYHQDAGSYQRKPVRKNPETTEQTALLMLFSFSLTMCRPLNRGFMIVALCSDFIHQKARYAGY